MKYININQGQNEASRFIQSNSPFISGDMIITVFHDRITFRKPVLGFVGRTHKFVLDAYQHGHSSFVSDCPLGRYEIDLEASNEDIETYRLSHPS